MANLHHAITLLATLAIGCASSSSRKRDAAALDLGAPEAASVQGVSPVAYELSTAADDSLPTLAHSAAAAEPLNTPQGETLKPSPSAPGLPLIVVEELALANSPAISQANACLRALHGKWVQAGLGPNPTVGYMASEIGAEGSAGQQGGFAGQQFVTANKLERNRAIVCAEIAKAEQQLATIVQRVQTDARMRYYNTLLAQRRMELAGDLVHLATEAAQASKALLEAQEIPLAGLLQTEVQLQNAQLLLRTSKNGLDQAWRKLQTLVGDASLPQQLLVGDVSVLPTDLDFENQLARLQSASPEIATAMAEVTRSRRALSRACVEAVPNVSAQLSVQYDDAANETLAGVQVGIPLPIWNRNQGGICQARAEVAAASRNVDRVELDLQQRLADAFRQYADARTTVQTYSEEILTRAERTIELVQQGYAQGEVGYLDLLAAQRTFSQTNLAYLDALGNLWQSYLRIDGLLLEGSLETEI